VSLLSAVSRPAALRRRQAKRIDFVVALNDAVNELNEVDGRLRFAFHVFKRFLDAVSLLWGTMLLMLLTLKLVADVKMLARMCPHCSGCGPVAISPPVREASGFSLHSPFPLYALRYSVLEYGVAPAAAPKNKTTNGNWALAVLSSQILSAGHYSR
jgi:hypothetical protein